MVRVFPSGDKVILMSEQYSIPASVILQIFRTALPDQRWGLPLGLLGLLLGSAFASVDSLLSGKVFVGSDGMHEATMAA
jgi:hypothetical protein